MFAEKTCFDELCTCKATLLSKMAKHVWRYSDDAGACFETCASSAKWKRSLSLNRVWDRTAALTCFSRSTAQKIVKKKKKAQDEQQQPRQRRKCHWRTLTRVLYGGPSPACTP